MNDVPVKDSPQVLASCIRVDAAGQPRLEGFRCSVCQEVLVEHRRGCPKCAAVGSLRPFPLADHGRLFSYTIVHRSFPGIRTPFISVVMELAGGGYLKGNLEGVEPTPAHVRFNMPLRVRFDQLPDDDGKPNRVRYFFAPLEDLR